MPWPKSDSAKGLPRRPGGSANAPGLWGRAGETAGDNLGMDARVSSERAVENPGCSSNWVSMFESSRMRPYRPRDLFPLKMVFMRGTSIAPRASTDAASS